MPIDAVRHRPREHGEAEGSDELEEDPSHGVEEDDLGQVEHGDELDEDPPCGVLGEASQERSSHVGKSSMSLWETPRAWRAPRGAVVHWGASDLAKHACIHGVACMRTSVWMCTSWSYIG